MNSTFDATATRFEQYRALPVGVPEAIRQAIWQSTGAPPSARVLDLGAGSGRIGRAFVEAGDSYVGADFSLPMLREFRARRTAGLLQADGGRLPFLDGCFDLVLLMQVLGGARNWRELLCESVRVVAPGGFIVVGQTITPPTGVDEQMRTELALILSKMGVEQHDARKSRGKALDWLRAGSSRRMHVTAASWTAQRTAREFLDRHRTAARFAALPPDVQEEALKRLRSWAERTCGSLDRVVSEMHKFELHVFRIGVAGEQPKIFGIPATQKNRGPSRQNPPADTSGQGHTQDQPTKSRNQRKPTPSRS